MATPSGSEERRSSSLSEDYSGPTPDRQGPWDTRSEPPQRLRSSHRLIASLALRNWFEILILVFAGTFWSEIQHMPWISGGYPRALIVLLLLLVARKIIANLVHAVRKGVLPTEEIEDHTGELALEEDAESWGRRRRQWQSFGRPAAVATATSAYVYLIPRLGFYEATAVFIGALAVLLGLRRPFIVILLVSGVVLISYLLFTVAFGLLLPAGPLIG